MIDFKFVFVLYIDFKIQENKYIYSKQVLL